MIRLVCKLLIHDTARTTSSNFHLMSRTCLGILQKDAQKNHLPPHPISTDSTCPAMQSLWLDLQVLVAHRCRFIGRIQMNHRSWRMVDSRLAVDINFPYVALVSYWILPSQQNTAREHHGVLYIYKMNTYTHSNLPICRTATIYCRVLPLTGAVFCASRIFWWYLVHFSRKGVGINPLETSTASLSSTSNIRLLTCLLPSAWVLIVVW